MQKHFPEYYPITEAQISEIWGSASVIFDANILLNLYRYDESTRKDFSEVMEFYKDRLWIPYQVALEYQRNRNSSIIFLDSAYDSLISRIGGQEEKVINDLKLNDFSRHPYINLDDIKKRIHKCFEGIISSIEKGRSESEFTLKKDPVFDMLSGYFDSKVGDDFSDQELEDIYKEGKKRYSEKIPPGYCDDKEKKDEGSRRLYGDLIVWKQVISYSKANSKNVIFVTDDHKEDWWQKQSGKTIGPRKELLKEFHDNTNQLILIYSGESFLKYAKKNTELKIKKKTIDEVAKTKHVDETMWDLNKLWPNGIPGISIWSDSISDGIGRPISMLQSYRNSMLPSRPDLESLTSLSSTLQGIKASSIPDNMLTLQGILNSVGGLSAPATSSIAQSTLSDEISKYLLYSTKDK